jgi:hypothetical protein
MTTLRGLCNPSDFPLTHTLLTYRRKLLQPRVSKAPQGYSTKPYAPTYLDSSAIHRRVFYCAVAVKDSLLR